MDNKKKILIFNIKNKSAVSIKAEIDKTISIFVTPTTTDITNIKPTTMIYLKQKNITIYLYINSGPVRRRPKCFEKWIDGNKKLSISLFSKVLHFSFDEIKESVQPEMYPNI